MSDIDDGPEQPENKIRVVLADDHRLVLEGVVRCLDIYGTVDVVGTATTAEALMDEIAETKPDVAILDINMPALNGLDAAHIISAKYPEIALMVLTMHDDREYISTALASGIRGYVLKDVSPREIVTAIETVHSGGTYLSAGAAQKLSTAATSCEVDAFGAQLSMRERAVLVLLADGKSNKQVAYELNISVRTVETHRKNLKRKLGIASTAGLTRYVIQNKLGRNTAG